MLYANEIRGTKGMLLAGILASGILVSPIAAQSVAGQSAGPPAPTPVPAVAAHSPYQPSRFSRRAEMHYGLVWGVDSLSVKWTESGEIIRFSYRVLDANKAKALNDKKLQPTLIDPQAGVSLVVPALEKVGMLRQTGTPEAGRIYWMAFSNKGRRVRRGDRVNVVIGNFHANGLVVD